MKRTDKQNRAYWLMCRMVADKLGAAGYSAQEVITLPITITPDIVHENIFKVIMRTMYPERGSTTELETTEMQQTFETMNAALAEKFGVSVDWPSQDGMSFAELLNEQNN